MSLDSDREYMLLALDLAKKGWGRTTPNPMVGAVIVKGNCIIGRGYHAKAGECHAEVNAICDAGDVVAGGTIYVTLEPCSTLGRTPPCVDAITEAGICRVVVGSLDPNPKHAGRGVDILRERGVEVVCGIEKEACDKLNESFFKWITTGLPFVILKMAMTLDGKIATSSGSSQWITGVEARRRVQHLRCLADAILVGGETARSDRPTLSVREVESWECQPRRLVASKAMSQAELTSIMPDGVPPELVKCSGSSDWQELFSSLGLDGVVTVLIEGGGELAAEVISAGVVDMIEFHIAPKILGGRNSRPVVGGSDPATLAQAFGVSTLSVSTLGDDIAVVGYLNT